MKKEWRLLRLTSPHKRSSHTCCITKAYVGKCGCKVFCRCGLANVSVTAIPRESSLFLCSIPGRDQRLKSPDGDYEFMLKDRSTKKKYTATAEQHTTLLLESIREDVNDDVIASIAKFSEGLNNMVGSCEHAARNTCAYIRQTDGRFTTFSFFPTFGTCGTVCGVVAIAQTGQPMSPMLCHGLLKDDRTYWNRLR
jgi:hypothetical protein